MISFGPKRRVLPPSGEGEIALAQRQVAQAVSKAAEKARVSVAIDAWRCRVWMRNPRAAVPCPCSTSEIPQIPGETSMANPDADYVIPRTEGNDLGWPDSGAPDPYGAAAKSRGPNDDYPPQPQFDVTSLERMLMGDGKRCGLCLGTGWLDGYRIYGAERHVLGACEGLPGVTVVGDATAMVDTSSDTPTFVGPGSVTWSVDLLASYPYLDSVRLRDGIGPARCGVVEGSVNGCGWAPLDDLLCTDSGPSVNRVVPFALPATLSVRLTLDVGERASHVEIITRGVDLVSLQLPQITQAAAREIIAPFVSEEFEVDPSIGAVERETLFEIPSVDGVQPQLYAVTDVTVKRASSGAIFGVTGTVRSLQPTEVLVAALLEDGYVGQPGQSIPPRALEATGSGVPAGAGNAPDSGPDALRRGAVRRDSGGENSGYTITLSSDLPSDG